MCAKTAAISGLYDVKTAKRLIKALVPANTPNLPAEGRTLYIAFPDGKTCFTVTAERAINGDRIYQVATMAKGDANGE